MNRRVGPYELLGLLGSGAMGEVHRARQVTLGRQVALKLLNESCSGDPEFRERFRREKRRR